MTSHNVETYKMDAGYGLTIDSNGLVWTAEDSGINKIARLKNGKSEALVLDQEYNFPRGAATGTALSVGYVWVANSTGDLLKISESTFSVENVYPLGEIEDPGTIGVAIDVDGYVWIVFDVTKSTTV